MTLLIFIWNMGRCSRINSIGKVCDLRAILLVIGDEDGLDDVGTKDEIGEQFESKPVLVYVWMMAVVGLNGKNLIWKGGLGSY